MKHYLGKVSTLLCLPFLLTGEAQAMPNEENAGTVMPTHLRIVMPMEDAIRVSIGEYVKDPMKAEGIYSCIMLEARDTGIPPYVIAGVIWQESKFQQDRIGADGELGLMQLPRSLWLQGGKDILSIRGNIHEGTNLLAEEICQHGGNIDEALMAIGARRLGKGLAGKEQERMAYRYYCGVRLYQNLVMNIQLGIGQAGKRRECR